MLDEASIVSIRPVKPSASARRDTSIAGIIRCVRVCSHFCRGEMVVIMSNIVHQTIPVQVWVDVDIGIADVVRYLNTIPGVRTHASCQGTIGEGGSAPYRAQVMLTWADESTLKRLQSEFDVEIEGDGWGYAHPRAKAEQTTN